MTAREVRSWQWIGRPARSPGAGSPWHPAWAGVGLALIGAVAIVAEALVHRGGRLGAADLLGLMAAAPLVFRVRAPLATLLVASAGAVICAAVLHASWTVTAIVALSLYTVARRGDRWRSLAVGLFATLLVIGAVLALDGTVDAGALATRLTLVVVCVAGGELLRTREELDLARAERLEREERERAEALRRAATDERMAIARELHDSLGHFLVAINVRASVAIEVPDATDAGSALADIKQVSASALHDLRSTLSALRSEDDLAPTTPAAQLDVLSGLVERTRSAGVATGLEVAVGEAALPAPVSAAAVRIVQESLTNVLRHAEASRADVSVRLVGRALCIEVVDDGVASVPGSGLRAGAEGEVARAGFGVRGMSERAAALGGWLSAGPRAGGGWCVRAELPLDAGAER